MYPVGFDLETAGSSGLFQYGPEFIRLWGAIERDEVDIGLDPPDVISRLNSAPWIYGHGIFNFDLLALCYWFGADWETLSAKAVDTMICSRLDYPPMARDTAGSVDKYDLDHCAERLGVPGKTNSIRELSRKHGGYDKIPLDDPEYHEYLTGDVVSIKAMVDDLLPRATPYWQREHKLASLAGRMTLNGFRVDLPLLEQRIAEGQGHKREALMELHEKHDLPLGRMVGHGRGKAKVEVFEEFSSPLATLEGKDWLRAIYKKFGVKSPPVTEKGELSTKAETLGKLAESTATPQELREIIGLMGTVTSTRTVYQTVQDHLAKGRVHALISMGQASGRWSVTEPGLTVFGKRGGRWKERDIFIGEPGHVIIACDMAQLDMRAMAGHSQDPNYMAMFAPGRDAHTEIALQVFGDASMRQMAKPVGHGWNYGLGENKLIAGGLNPDVVHTFFEMMKKKFPLLCAWRDHIRAEGAAGHLLDNGFGRKMRCDPSRAYTQAPALMGQGGATDIMKEALIRLPDELRPYLRVLVHDEIVLSVPEEDADEIGREVERAMTFTWKGVPILCDLSKPGKSWGDVSAK